MLWVPRKTMPTVRFTRVGLEVEVPVGVSILDAAELASAPHGSHCGGVRACSKCHVYVTHGASLLTPATEDEAELLELSAQDLEPSSRLGCQAILKDDGTVSVRISEESFQYYFDAHPSERDRVLRLWLG